MKKILLFSIIIMAVAWGALVSANSPSNNTIKVFSWWDYIDESILNKFNRDRGNVRVTTYNTNELALTRIMANDDDFDVVIVSNFTEEFLVKKNKIKKNIFEPRNYIKKIFKNSSSCLPYLWSATLYFVDSRYTKIAPVEMIDFIKLKEKGHNVKIIDDPFEFYNRLYLEEMATVDSIQHISFSKYLEGLKHNTHKFSLLRSENFITDLSDIIIKEKLAVYGWHGEIAKFFNESSWLEPVIPKGNLIIGYDSVCIMNKHYTKDKLIKLKEFVQELTSRKNTSVNVAKTQYFSPYSKDYIGLHNKTKKIRLKVESEILKNNFSVLHKPTERAHMIMNVMWRKMRYVD
jgi:spermidine/putrescine-binding protein